jgi:nitrile hydratase subunit beta
MGYVHDIGGLYGFGAVPGTDDELEFHAAWEVRLFGIGRSLVHNRHFTVDELRHAVERMDPADYLAASYFERWACALELLCEEKGILTPDERAAIVAAGEEPAG